VATLVLSRQERWRDKGGRWPHSNLLFPMVGRHDGTSSSRHALWRDRTDLLRSPTLGNKRFEGVEGHSCRANEGGATEQDNRAIEDGASTWPANLGFKAVW
jgi:hypothetical protein